MSTDSTNTLDYWTPVAKTLNERYAIERDLGVIFRKAMSDRRLVSSLRTTRNFSAQDNSPQEFCYSLDSYHHRRSVTTEIIDALLADLGIQDPQHYIRTPIKTEFMYQGVKVVLHHYLQGTDDDRNTYADTSTQALYLGYGRIVDVFNIILRGSGFYIDEYLSVKFKSDSGRDYLVERMGDCASRMLGMKSSAYNHYVYSSFRSVDEVVNWFLDCKFVNLASLHFNNEKEYIGPDDYFGSVLFRKIVENIQSRPMVTLNNTAMQSATIKRKQFEIWKSCNPITHHQYATNVVLEQQNTLINAKLTDELIREVVTQEADDLFIKSFRNMFETEVSQKEDYAFFVLSSSQETLKNRMSELHQKLTG